MSDADDDGFDWGVFDEPRSSTRLWGSRASTEPADPAQDPGRGEDPGTRRGGRRRRGVAAAAAAAVAVALIAAALLLLGGGGGGGGEQTLPDPAAAAAADPLPQANSMTAEVWPVTGAVLPVSVTEGPARNDTLAAGFARSAEGAAIAAAHLSVRVDPRTGPAVFTPTIRDQMDGQTDRVLAAVSADYTRLATQAGVTDGGPLPVPSLARITGYRVAGDPATGAVTVHLLVESGAGERDFAVPLVWAGQQPDWRLLAPAPGASTLFAVAEPSGDYTPVPEAQR